MSKLQSRPVSARVLKADAEAHAAIKKIKSYNPSNSDFTLAKLQAAADAVRDADDALAQSKADWKTTRDERVTAQHTYHDAVLGAKKQVVAQYGEDANEVQAVGLTKKSERAKPVRKQKPAATK